MSRLNNKYRVLSPTSLFSFSASELFNFLEENYAFWIPMHLDTPDEMRLASELTAQITNSYAYLLSLNSSLRVMILAAKNNGTASKADIEVLKEKKAIIQNKCEGLKMQYQALSRILTIKQEINKELSMSDTKSFG